MAAKEMVPALYEESVLKKIRFPKTSEWDEKRIKREILTQLLSCHVEGGDGFDTTQCMQQLIERYGADETKDGKSKKRAAAEIEENDDTHKSGNQSPGKIKKRDVVACEENRSSAAAIQEIADEYFKQKEHQKGGVYAKAAKAIRECPTFLSNSKEACKLKGVGKSIGGAIEELLNTGSIARLEKLRAGDLS